jgi:hypothetical protein
MKMPWFGIVAIGLGIILMLPNALVSLRNLL